MLMSYQILIKIIKPNYTIKSYDQYTYSTILVVIHVLPVSAAHSTFFPFNISGIVND